MIHIKLINNENCNFCLKLVPTYEVKGGSRLVVNICQDCINEIYSKIPNKGKVNGEPIAGGT